MTSGLKVSPENQAALRCPKCHGRLSCSGDRIACQTPQCGMLYPIVDGIPVLINEDRSVFALSDFASQRVTTFHAQPAVERFLSHVIPELGRNLRAERNYRRLAALLKEFSASPKVLVVGCGEVGRGMGPLTSDSAIELVNTDVSFMPGTQMICDSHDLPFQDEQFDGAIIQAVLEHVADPPRCVEELRRVLKSGALIYAETPFIQQVHGGPYDFTRYTHLGHRRLFRGFEEIGSGATAGSGTALAWSYQYFLLSFVRTPFARSAVKAVARLTSFWLRYFDYFLLDSPGTLDAASGYFFLGRKCGEPIPDRQLIALYRGAGSTLPVTN